jgi:hypothetical protein
MNNTNYFFGRSPAQGKLVDKLGLNDQPKNTLVVAFLSLIEHVSDSDPGINAKPLQFCWPTLLSEQESSLLAEFRGRVS